MKGRTWLNLCLLLACGAVLAAYRIVPPRDVTRPHADFLLESQMAYSAAFDAFDPNPNFPDGLTLRTPPPGTIARGQLPLHYEPTPADAVRAGVQLDNPFSQDDVQRLNRGSVVFANFCQLCHGRTGLGNTAVTQRGFPRTPSLLNDRAVHMKDGQMFHVLTYGQGNMPAHAAQLSRDDRWAAILHVRLLQRARAPSSEPGSAPLRIEAVALRFRENCVACHGEDGTGSVIRSVLPLIPDFTSLAWQASQTDVAIVNGINYGALPLMPSYQYKLPPRQVLELAVYVRTFTTRPAPAGSPAGTPAAAPVTAHVAPEDVYRTYCFACHDSNGKGNSAIRMGMADLPDFTLAAWQKSHTDAELDHSVLEGKGKFMLPMKDKLGAVNVKQMVALVRSFQGGKKVVPIDGPKAPGPQLNGPTAPVVAGGAAADTAAPSGKTTPDKTTPGETTPGETPSKDAAAAKPGAAPTGDLSLRIHVGAGIFRQFCIVCHGADGTGSLLRAQMPAIPDFTKPAWQKEHANPKLLVSIMDGKGTLMPANRGRVTDAQAHDLVAYIRSFGPQGSQGQPVNVQASGTDFDKSFDELEKRWNELEKQLQATEPSKTEK